MRAAAKPPVTTSIRLVWPFVALAEKSGYDVSRIAAAFGLSRAQFENPETRVAQQLVANLLNEAVTRSGVRDLGLFAARLVDSRHIGIGEYVARTRPTLREAIESTSRYLPLLGDGAGHVLETRGKRAHVKLWFSPDLVIHEAAYEFAAAIGVLRARRITGMQDLAPIEVHFMHARPASIARHEKLFRCKLRFGAEITQIVLSAQALDMRMSSAEPALNELLERQADAMLQQLPQSRDLADHVRALLGAELDLRGASAERVARRLGMSVRTLSRKLGDEGTSYRDLIDEARKQAALRDLAHDAQPIAEIADRLGFASPQSFHRAFKRWTGTTADAVRKRARSAPGK
jgi:AraC-like DNA-binding protein